LKQAILYGARDLRIEDTPLDCETLQPDQIYAETGRFRAFDRY
jgi:hypothetical protein